MSIGAVLELLRPEFPDVTISKIRFLEEQGLVEPDRSPAGYRKFDHADVERLRYVLSVQRDHYLPLRVIREQLAALECGEPAALPGGGPRLVSSSGAGADARERPEAGVCERLDRAALLRAAGAREELLVDVEAHGLVAARPGTGRYDAEAVTVLRTAVDLAAFGIGPRHLRAFRGAADREAGLVEQVVGPVRRQRGAESAARAEEIAREVTGLCVRLHGALLRSALERGGA